MSNSSDGENILGKGERARGILNKYTIMINSKVVEVRSPDDQELNWGEG